jgi:hypothetical protein
MKTGCLLLTLPRMQPFPRLTAKLSYPAKRRVLATHVISDNTPHRVSLFVVSAPRRRLAEALLMPDAAGRLDETLSFEVPNDVNQVCAIARWYRPGKRARRLRTPRCPPVTATDTSWILLSPRGS